MLEEIIHNNSELSKVPRLVSILKKVESIIPQNLRENFYMNLKTLRINFSSEYNVSCYDYSKNIISINPGYHKYLLGEWSKDKQKEQLLLMYDSTLCHELIHMASTKYDESGEKINSGFSSGENGVITNSYLNEGFTEVLTGQIYSQRYDFSGYQDIVHLVMLIINIIGEPDIIANLYFSNSSVDDLKQHLALSKFGLDCDELFSNIENLYKSKSINDTNEYNHYLIMLIKYDIRKLIYYTVVDWVKSGTFTSREELQIYYDNYLKHHIISLINILKHNNYNLPGNSLNELDFEFDNFLRDCGLDYLFASSIKK